MRLLNPGRVLVSTRGTRVWPRCLATRAAADLCDLSYSWVKGAAAAAGASRRTGLVLHGLLGNKNNLRSLARSLVAAHPDLQLLLVDQRGHGDSPAPPASAPHTVASAAADALHLATRLGVSRMDLVVGHSFGGKVALAMLDEAALAHAPGGARPAHVFVLDSMPGSMSAEAMRAKPAESVSCVLEALRDIAAAPIPSREWLVQELCARGFAEPLAKWMTTNLRPLPAPPSRDRGGSAGSTYAFTFDLRVADALFHDYLGTDLLHLAAPPPAGTHVHVVRALRNPAWEAQAGALTRLAAAAAAPPAHHVGRTRLHEIDAGHWLHTERPDAVLSLIAGGL